MTSAAQKLPDTSLKLKVGPVMSQQNSKLFPSLFRLRDVNRRLTVLEIGPALPETVDFFSQFKCRLHFVDLFNEPFVRDQQGQLSQTELRQAFEGQLRFPAETRFDLVLLWDFLCYLDDPALKAFNAALRPWVQAGTRAHGFGAHHMAIRLENLQFGIKDEETFCVRKRHTDEMPHHPHSQIEMHEMLTCFDFERGLLLPNGKLEMLLKPRD